MNAFKHFAYCPTLLATILAGMTLPPALASSHREAPFITRMPTVDGTDFYMFKSYETARAAYTTLIANYIPLQDAYGGPNYFLMNPDALYEIHVDNNGDGVEDLTFQFRFSNTNKNTQLTVGSKQVSIPLLINGGPISTPNAAGANVRETYTAKVVRGGRRSGTVSDIANAAGGATVFDKPFDNIGNKAIPNYAAYAALHVYNINIPGCATPARMFVGQRKDPFVVNLGETFDLLNIPGIISSSGSNTENGRANSLADKNVTSIEMEVATNCLTAGVDPVIGGWTTASVRQARVINPTPGNGGTSKEGGAWTQVSRVGMPLVNEVVIGLKDKDQFNHSKPGADAQFADYVTNPTFPALVQILYPAAQAPTNFPRLDLVYTFLTGIATINRPAIFEPADPLKYASEMLRLNTSIAATVAASQSRLGVLGGDNAGFPNGRRPGDDVVDAVLRVAMGRLCHIASAVAGCVAADAPAGLLDFTDGASVDASAFDTAFPYLRTPIPGSPQ